MSNMLKIAFVGAGQVNFGGGEGPWNHSKRIEELSDQLKNANGAQVQISVVGIYDPNVPHAERTLENQRKKSKHPSIWADTQVFNNLQIMLDSVKIDAVFIGVPPGAHGSTSAPSDIEIQCAQRKIHMFVEKPLSCHPVTDVSQVSSILSANKDIVVSVGYMFRYSQAVRKMKEIIATYGEPRAFMARYNCAYTTIAKEMWWDVTVSGGPIVEQATHFCDLARYIVGEVDLDTVTANSVKQTHPLGKLQGLPPNIANLENVLPEVKRIPRVTCAQWRFKNGAMGSLLHGVLLHGNKYESEIEVWGDGYRMVLADPYGKCELSVRLPGSEQTISEQFRDDAYFLEDKVFLEAILHGNRQEIASPYEDAFHTYAFSWKIRTQCE